MCSEFRLYGKLNCTVFDLISGDLEPKQTKALGFLLSESQLALSVFLGLIKHCGLKYDKVIVDCEAQRKQQGNNDRIDILLRFYLNRVPQIAFIVEAKSAGANTSAHKAAIQAAKYTSGFRQLSAFKGMIHTITLTREVKEITQCVSLSWSELITALFPKASKDKHIKDFLTFFLNIKHGMKYYDEEILSIPAGVTYDAIMSSGIYECPVQYKTKKRSLFITFRNKKGLMDRLYKLTDIVEFDINEMTAINEVNKTWPGFKTRLSTYKQTLRNQGQDPVSGNKRVYILDLDHPLVLPFPVRPVENNASPVYYSLHEFLTPVNSSIDCVIVQKDVSIENDILSIHTNGKKIYHLFDKSGNKLQSFATVGTYGPLQVDMKYELIVQGSNRNVELKRICLEYVDKKWTMFYQF